MDIIIFWGAGKIGKSMLSLWRQFGIQPDFFADNSPKLWGSWQEGIRVLSIEELKAIKKVKIVITCKEIESISIQLLGCSIGFKDIYIGNTLNDMLIFLMRYMKDKIKVDIISEKRNSPEVKNAFNVLFDVQYGFVLGGVEAWVLQMAEMLSERKVNIKFITTDIKGWIDQHHDDRVMQLEYQKEISIIDKFMSCFNMIWNNMPSNIVCNFTGYTFWAACMAKALWPQDVNLIAVVHNDHKEYYENYGIMHKNIDYCLVTCDKMESILVEQGMEKQKILRLAWDFPCERELERTYSKANQPIRIGYAGRIVKHPKRMDILIEVARKLAAAKVDFHIEIAGTGEYESEMRKRLEDISDQVSFVGSIEREHMYAFWKNQDIGINCSDFEGRCISKVESMAAGAVPIITDTWTPFGQGPHPRTAASGR